MLSLRRTTITQGGLCVLCVYHNYMRETGPRVFGFVAAAADALTSYSLRSARFFSLFRTHPTIIPRRIHNTCGYPGTPDHKCVCTYVYIIPHTPPRPTRGCPRLGDRAERTSSPPHGRRRTAAHAFIPNRFTRHVLESGRQRYRVSVSLCANARALARRINTTSSSSVYISIAVSASDLNIAWPFTSGHTARGARSDGLGAN